MALLDSILAFALTLAALATVATLILEIAFRILRLKRIGQLRMVEKMITHAEALRDGNGNEEPAKGQDERIELLLANPFAVGLRGFLKNLYAYWWKARAFYEDISLEHTLRRLVDVVAEKDGAADEVKKRATDKLAELALKYDEYCGALAVRFKQNAQRWSLVAGVVLAFGMNVDGFRILETYLQDPDLREQAIVALQRDEDGKQDAPAAAEPAAAPEPDAAQEELQQKYDELRAQVSVISGLNLPIGWSYFPYCSKPSGDRLPDPNCGDAMAIALGDNATLGQRIVAYWNWATANQNLTWITQVLITGLLIGLGAPFWYDVARRLAAVRSSFGGKGTAEERHRGEDGGQSPWARKQLIQRIVDDFLTFGVPGEKRPGGGQTPSNG